MTEPLRVQLHQDPLVDRIMSGPEALAAPTDVRVLYGFLAKKADGVWTLHSKDFLSHVDIKEEDIIHAQQVDPAKDPRGGTTLYVRASAMPDLKDFLSGIIAEIATGRPRTPDIMARLIPTLYPGCSVYCQSDT